MVMVAADTVDGHTIIIQAMDNIMAAAAAVAAAFQMQLLRAPAFMGGTLK